MTKKKKDHTPFVLKLIQWGYPKAEAIVPPLAYRFFLTLFFTPLKYKAPEKEKKAESFSEKFTVTVSGKRIQCYKWGNAGKMVLLIHGWAGRSTQFRRFIKPLLAAGYQVIGFDGPAHGQSEGKRATIADFVETLKAIYMVVGNPEAIITHSFGGGVALYAAMNGLPIKTLVNIASPTIGDEIINNYLRVIGGSDKTKNFFKKEIQKRYGRPFEEFTGLYAIQNIKQDLNLLLVYDDNDKEVPVIHAHALIEHYPKAELMHTHGLGHNRILKDNAVISRVVTFITDHSSGK